jgi:hypothetical protein
MRPIDGDALLAEYDRVHEGPPGKARTLIENAPTIELKLIYCKDCVRKCTFREMQGPGGYCRYGRDKDWNLNPQMRGDTDEQNNESYL